MQTETGRMLERCEAAIGQAWTAEMHMALVHHIAELERCYQEIIRRRETPTRCPVTDPARLLELVLRCREADTALETAREYGDVYDRNQAQAARDAAHRRLGAEWREIAALVADSQVARKAFGTVHNCTGRLVYCECCGDPINAGDSHGCPPTMGLDAEEGT